MAAKIGFVRGPEAAITSIGGGRLPLMAVSI